MRRDFLSVDADDMLDAALTRVQESECCLTAPVMQQEKMVGLLTSENVREFLLIASALDERRIQKVVIAS
jgi:predicted transcriptional regulator